LHPKFLIYIYKTIGAASQRPAPNNGRHENRNGAACGKFFEVMDEKFLILLRSSG
jgi:hypothetical protein